MLLLLDEAFSKKHRYCQKRIQYKRVSTRCPTLRRRRPVDGQGPFGSGAAGARFTEHHAGVYSYQCGAPEEGIPEGAPPDFFRKLVQADHVLRDQYGTITNRSDLRPIDLKLTKKYKVVKKANTPEGNFDPINYQIIKNTPSSTKYKNFVKFPLGESSDR